MGLGERPSSAGSRLRREGGEPFPSRRERELSRPSERGEDLHGGGRGGEPGKGDKGKGEEARKRNEDAGGGVGRHECPARERGRGGSEKRTIKQAISRLWKGPRGSTHLLAALARGQRPLLARPADDGLGVALRLALEGHALAARDVLLGAPHGPHGGRVLHVDGVAQDDGRLQAEHAVVGPGVPGARVRDGDARAVHAEAPVARDLLAAGEQQLLGAAVGRHLLDQELERACGGRGGGVIGLVSY